MRRQVLGVDAQTGLGQIAGDDGHRYSFTQNDWDDVAQPARGARVDFEVDDTRALDIFLEPGVPMAAVGGGLPGALADDRNRYIAALIAFVLGPFGVHRFYLGRTGSGLAMLLLTCTIVGVLVTGVWGFVDMVRYLVMSDEEFAARYARVTGSAPAGGHRSLPPR